MERTKFPATIKSDTKVYTFDEITEGLSNTDKRLVLENETDITVRLINIKKDVYQIGKRLHENKQILPYGMYIPWIELTFGNDLPPSTAYLYRRIYEVFKDHESTVPFIPSPFLLMVTTKKFPAEVVKLLNENPKNITKNALQNVNEVYSLFKDGTIGGSQFIKLSEKQLKLGIDIMKGRSTHRLNANMRHSFELGAGDILKRINEVRKIAREMASGFPYDPNSQEHKKLIKTIDDSVDGLKELKMDIESSRALFKSISTKNGNKYIDNL